MVTRRLIIQGSIASGAAFALPLSSASAQVVDKPARLVVAFPPGGSADTVARLLTNNMKDYAPALIVDNKPGAGGRIGLENVKASAADGTTMILTPASMIVLYPHVYKKLAYDPVADFTAVTTVCSSPFSLTVGPKVPEAVKSVTDFIAWCKENPKDASYGSSGAGSMPHFAGVMLSRAANVEIVHVPYKGAAPAIQDLLGGQIAANMAVLSTALPHIQSGKLRSLAITSAARSPFLPNTPTLQEAGFKDLVAEEWFGIFAPTNLPTAQLEKMNAAVRKSLGSSEVQEGLKKFSFTPASSTAQEFAALVRADHERWGPIIKASGFTPEE